MIASQRCSKSGSARIASSVVIATRNRPQPLTNCLLSLADQTLLPTEVLIIDSSRDDSTEQRIRDLRPSLPFQVSYHRSPVVSAAVQRNIGADLATGDLLFFLDDDIILDSDFTRQIARVFEEDTEETVGGVCGTIVNQSYSPKSRRNRFLLRVCLGEIPNNLAGKLIGPGVNFRPADVPETVQPVEWLSSAGVAYRRDVFHRFKFPESFSGYSFAEDVYLSARMSKTHRLLNSTFARLEHKDLGRQTHHSRFALGEMRILNRHAIMAYVLGRSSALDHLRLFGYELVYLTATQVADAQDPKALWRIGQELVGKLKGAGKILIGKSPHTVSTGIRR